jgi:amino acid permease
MFDLIGGIAVSFIVYIFPALFYIRICRGESKWKYAVSWFLVPFGLVISVVSLYDSIHHIIHGD